MSEVSSFIASTESGQTGQNLTLWIQEDLNASLDDIVDLHMKRDTAKMLRNKSGEKPPDGYEWFVSLETIVCTATLKDGSKHSIRCVTDTGELIELECEASTCQ